MTSFENLGINIGFLLVFCLFVVIVVASVLSAVYMFRQMGKAGAVHDDLSAMQQDVRRLLEENLAAQRETNELLRKLVEGKQI